MRALTIDNYWGTSVYAPQNRKPHTAETVSMDAFARRERVTSLVPHVMHISVGSQEIKLTIQGTTPLWFEPVITSMSKRWGFRPGWDSYDARPTDLEHAIKLLNYLSQILPNKAVAPIITPLADGGLQAEWHHGDKDIEIVVPFGEPARYYYFDATADVEEEDKLEENFKILRDHINKL